MYTHETYKSTIAYVLYRQKSNDVKDIRPTDLNRYPRQKAVGILIQLIIKLMVSGNYIYNNLLSYNILERTALTWRNVQG